ncbi:hypothetical protein BH09GEM1_BH09GEM1_22400 [soil metagenome]
MSSLLVDSHHIDQALTRVGDLLSAEGFTVSVAILGGAALNLLGIIERATRDVDVLAIGHPSGERPTYIGPPDEHLPSPLRQAVAIVGKDFGLLPDWMNTGPALQWKQGLPPGLETRVHWKLYGDPRQGGLWVGLIDRFDLIFFKLFAATDSTGPNSVHYQDLVALAPTAIELDQAITWVHDQDASASFHDVLKQVAGLLRHDLDIEPEDDDAD